jgi:putative CocE/NonD family hydrolase
MYLRSLLLERLIDLPPAKTRDVVVDRDLRVPMADGTVLLADRLYPRGGGRLPTILIRSPYGRRGFFGLMGLPFAERGFQVLIQSCRGTFGSGGVLDPFRNERADGLATVAWLKEQPWFSGEMATFGPSYLGLVQWALAREAGPALKAMALQVTTSDFQGETYAGGSFTLHNALSWAHLIHHQERPVPLAMLAQALQGRVLVRAFHELRLSSMDALVVGKRVGFFQDWLAHEEPDDLWWKPAVFSEGIDAIEAPATMLGGWYDIFLPWQLRDYEALVRAGRRPHLTIGPWVHADREGFAVGLCESLAWFRAHLLGDRSALREAPVRLFVMGSRKWREYPAWPPPGMRQQRWHLQAGGGLDPRPPSPSAPDRYRYDPADPTPSVGGALLTKEAGPRDNRALEARRDVITYTSAPLERDLSVIGPVEAEIFFQSTLPHTDLFARVCDVDPAGRSVNLCDGLLRLSPGKPAAGQGGVLRVALDLWPTAHLFRRGHRVRLQISSGAHPRYARNPGTGERLGTATRLLAADQTIHHDPEHPSALLLPIVD